MRRVTGLLGATALVAAMVAGSAGSASTSEPSGATTTDPPWIPYEQEDVTYPAGEYCDFEVRTHVLHDREFYRDVSTYADGTPRTQLWKGPLLLRLTNTESGESIEINASGRSIMQYGPGEAFESITIQSGHFLGGARAGSEPSRGIYHVSGRWTSMSRNDDGSSTFFLGPHGSAENLCEPLTP